MIQKIFMIVVVFMILYCLGSALYFMLFKKNSPEKTAVALTWRVILSVSLFLLLMVGFSLGWIHPHGL